MPVDRKKETMDFSLIIENLSRRKKIPYMDAVILHCETTGLEVEVASKLLTNRIKAQIKTEAEELNFLPKSKKVKLPL